MDTSARKILGTRGRRLIPIGAALAFACGFVGHAAVPDEASSPPAPSVAAAHPDLAAWRPPVRDRTARALDTSVHARAPRPPRIRSFAADVGEHVWRAVHGGVDGALWRHAEPSADAAGHGRGLPGIGFPAISGERGRSTRVYRPLIAWQDTPDGRVPLAHVRCMGLRPAAVARRAARYERLIVELAIAEGVSASLVKAVVTEESCFDPDAVSPVGAIGLMQLMPATAKWLKVSRPHLPEANLRGGIRYLAMLKRRYDDTALALAAYNAGPGNVARYGGIPPFAETRRYVKRVMSHHRSYAAATALAAR